MGEYHGSDVVEYPDEDYNFTIIFSRKSCYCRNTGAL